MPIGPFKRSKRKKSLLPFSPPAAKGMCQTRLIEAGSWLSATQRRVSQCPHVLMSDLLTAQFLAAMPFNTSWCVSSCSTFTLKQTWQYFISVPLGSTSMSGVQG